MLVLSCFYFVTSTFLSLKITAHNEPLQSLYSMAFIIAFILPCGCFIVIENAVPGGDRKDNWIWVAWAILSFSVVGAIVCTLNNMFGFGH